MKRNLLAASISTGIAGAFPWLVRGDFRAAAIGAAAGALVFGGLSSWVQRRNRARLLRYGDVPTEIPVRPILTVVVDGSAQGVIDTVQETLAMFARVDKVSVSATGEAQVLAEVPRSLRHGLGERLAVSVMNSQAGRTKVVIASRPRSEGALIDFGRNYSHVQRIQNALVVRFGKASVEILGVAEAT